MEIKHNRFWLITRDDYLNIGINEGYTPINFTVIWEKGELFFVYLYLFGLRLHKTIHFSTQTPFVDSVIKHHIEVKDRREKLDQLKLFVPWLGRATVRMRG